VNRETMRRSLGALILLIMAATALYGGDMFGLRERLPPPATRISASAADPFIPVEQDGPEGGEASVRRSDPYWVPVRRFEGSGPSITSPFAIDPVALQWRVNWRCQKSPLRIQPQRPSGEDDGRRLADTGACPQTGSGLSVGPGRYRLAVQTPGRWVAEIEQQVDVPLVEPPTARMTAQATRMVASGQFYGIDEEGEGTVKLFRHEDGSASLRLEDFYVTPNVDLEIRFSEARRPQTTEQVTDAPFEDVVFLEATAGEMNYRIPPGVLSDRVRSVVIWCETITDNAYAAASLQR